MKRPKVGERSADGPKHQCGVHGVSRISSLSQHCNDFWTCGAMERARAALDTRASALNESICLSAAAAYAVWSPAGCRYFIRPLESASLT